MFIWDHSFKKKKYIYINATNVGFDKWGKIFSNWKLFIICRWSSELLRGDDQIISWLFKMKIHPCSTNLVFGFCSVFFFLSIWAFLSFFTFPMTKMLDSLVAKLFPVLSLTWTTSKEPGWRSLLVITPIRPKLAPPVTMHKFAEETKSNLYLTFTLNGWKK